MFLRDRHDPDVRLEEAVDDVIEIVLYHANRKKRELSPEGWLAVKARLIQLRDELREPLQPEKDTSSKDG